MQQQSSQFPEPIPGVPRKLCFVTVGATAPFNKLIHAVLERPFLQALKAHGYTDLLIQYGRGGEKELEEAEAVETDKGVLRHGEGVRIAGFGFREDGLSYEMRTASGRGFGGFDAEGLIISHAGSGSILEGLRLGVPLIVVPNTELLDNHQVDLAEELEGQGYVIYGKLEDGNLADTVSEAEELRRKTKSWPPVNSGTGPPTGLSAIIDEELGFRDLD